MSKHYFTLMRVLICLGLLSICQIVSAQGVKSKEASTDPNQVLQDLLTEVRGLRRALERATSNASRAQILMERIRLAQPKVDNLTGQLSSVRKAITQEIATQADLTEMMSECESKMGTNQTIGNRTDYEKACKSYPATLESSKQHEQRLQEQENALATQLQVEQSKLDELNDRLDKLDRELQDLNSADKTPTKKNP